MSEQECLCLTAQHVAGTIEVGSRYEEPRSMGVVGKCRGDVAMVHLTGDEYMRQPVDMAAVRGCRT